MKYQPPRPPLEMEAKWRWCKRCHRPIGKKPSEPWIRVKGVHVLCWIKWVWACLTH